MTDLQALYRLRVARGELKADPAQTDALAALESCYRQLLQPPQNRWWQKLFRQTPALSGVYIHGSVGRGKTVLMDLFYQAVPEPKKQRLHFHDFMRLIHQRLQNERRTAARDPLQRVADGIDLRLLCLDELQILDIADAMIVGRLFARLLDNGVVVVITSNRPPADLYKDGLQRELFLPFIRLLEQRLQVIAVAGAHDYRRLKLVGRQVYFTPADGEGSEILAKLFADLTDYASTAPLSLDVGGRRLLVSQAVKRVALFTFDELCRQPLGATDYAMLADSFNTILIDGVPVMGVDDRDIAKRFVTLIDVLYDRRVKVIISADAAAEKLYPQGSGSFEFQRTASRLLEMQSEDYLKM